MLHCRHYKKNVWTGVRRVISGDIKFKEFSCYILLIICETEMTHRWHFYSSDLIVITENVESRVKGQCSVMMCQRRRGPPLWSVCSVDRGSAPAASAAPETQSWVRCLGSDARRWWPPPTTGPGRSADTQEPALQIGWCPWHSAQTPSLEDIVPGLVDLIAFTK